MSARKTQAQTAYETLRREVLAGEWAGGTKITEIASAARLGIGRAAVREALRRLAGEGLVEKIRASYRVVSVSSEDAPALRQLREIFEVGSLRLCAREGLPKRALASIHRANSDFASLVAKGYFSGAREADLRFHRELVAACGNRKLLELYDSANLPLFQKFLAGDDRLVRDHALAVKEHGMIEKALAEGKFEAAMSALVAHLQRGEILLRST
ncbi:GntR family transcriptional regulator [Nibricoccus sp. IMCC34717]|uniref:GntR family transcriptional regulator n=1 Tax=Nibricoccus sp. IMCC34717 TaxID=3034021 RepID=UPI0038517309